MAEENQVVDSITKTPSKTEADDKKTTPAKVSRRDFLKGALAAITGMAANTTGAYKAIEAVGLDATEESVINVTNWKDSGEFEITAFPDKNQVEYQAKPTGWPEFNATLTHIGFSKPSELAPRQKLFEALESTIRKAVDLGFIREHQAKKYRLVGGLFPYESALRVALLTQSKLLLRDVEMDGKAYCKTKKEDGNFLWAVETKDGEYKGNGYTVPIEENDVINFVSGEDFPGKNVVGMKTSVWLREFTGVKNITGHGDEKLGNASIEHNTGAAFVIEKKDREGNTSEVVGLAGPYANHSSVSYADMVVSDRRLTQAENNFLNTFTPFAEGRNKPNAKEAEWISEVLTDKTCAGWRDAYPDKPFHQGQTFVFDKQKKTFRVVSREDRLKVINDLSENEVWITPGDIFLLDGQKHFSKETRFNEATDMTLNGFLAAPQGDGTYKAVAVVTTDQLRRFSLSHAEQIADDLRKQIGLPEGTILINTDQHGSGGIFVGEKN